MSGEQVQQGDPGPAATPGPLCPCGCRRVPSPGSKYADYERCRQRAHKARLRARLKARGLPATLTLESAERLSPTRARSRDGQRPAHARHTRRSPALRVTVPDALVAEQVRAHLAAMALEGFEAAGVVAAALERAIARRTK